MQTNIAVGILLKQDGNSNLFYITTMDGFKLCGWVPEKYLFFFQSNFNTGVLILLDEWKLLGHKSSSSSHKSPSKSSSSGHKSSSSGHKSSSSGHKSSSSGHKSSSGGHKRERESSGDRHKKSPKKARKWTASVLRNIPAKKRKRAQPSTHPACALFPTSSSPQFLATPQIDCEYTRCNACASFGNANDDPAFCVSSVLFRNWIHLFEKPIAYQAVY